MLSIEVCYYSGFLCLVFMNWRTISQQLLVGIFFAYFWQPIVRAPRPLVPGTAMHIPCLEYKTCTYHSIIPLERALKRCCSQTQQISCRLVECYVATLILRQSVYLDKATPPSVHVL